MKKICFGMICCIAGAFLMIACSTKPQNSYPNGGATKGVALGDLTVDRCVFYIEGESFSDKSGGDFDYKDAAYGKKCLGMRWGEKPTDFVDYNVLLDEPIESAIMVIRVAIDNPRAQAYEIVLDGKTIQSAEFAPTGGYGYTEKEWQCYTVPMGKIEKGRHVLKLRPTDHAGILNIDCLALGKGK